MGEALRETGRPTVFSLCEYGWGDVQTWGALVGGNLWRTTGDIEDNWGSMLHNILEQEAFAAHAGQGHWNDPDMLEVGNGGMTPEEYRTHFSLWAIAAAPLIAGNDLRHMTAVTRSILLNRDVIAVDQDSLGQQGKLLSHHGFIDVWVRPLSGDAYAVAIVNSGETSADFKPDWSAIGLSGTFRGRDLWSHADVGVLSQDHTAHVPSHGVVMLKLTRAAAGT
jgi:alpha-galactosidase